MFFCSTVLVSRTTELDFSFFCPLSGSDTSWRWESLHFTHKWDIPECSCLHRQNHLMPNEGYAKVHIRQNYGALPGDSPSISPTYIATVHTDAVLHRIVFYLCKVQGPLLDLE